MRIAFQVNVPCFTPTGNGDEKETKSYFLIIPAKLTCMDDEDDSKEFAECAAGAVAMARRNAQAETGNRTRIGAPSVAHFQIIS